MKIKRTYTMKQKLSQIVLDDVICFKLKDGEKCEARAVKLEDGKMLMVFEDCLRKEYPMNKTNTTEGGYEASYLRQALNTEILERFPNKIRKHMEPFENGDYLRILSEKEVFGINTYGEDDGTDTKQLPAMKLRKNRIASQGLNGDYEYWWLRDVVSASAFALVTGNGFASSASASHAALGVRPAFQISQITDLSGPSRQDEDSMMYITGYKHDGLGNFVYANYLILEKDENGKPTKIKEASK